MRRYSRLGPVVVTLWIGGLKVTHCEAEGTVPFVVQQSIPPLAAGDTRRLRTSSHCGRCVRCGQCELAPRKWQLPDVLDARGDDRGHRCTDCSRVSLSSRGCHRRHTFHWDGSGHPFVLIATAEVWLPRPGPPRTGSRSWLLLAVSRWRARSCSAPRWGVPRTLQSSLSSSGPVQSKTPP